MPTRIAVVSLCVEDVSTAAHFYRDVLGLNLLPHHGGRLHFDLGGSYLVLLKGQTTPAPNQSSERFPLVAFAVDDLDSSIHRLQVHQVELPWGIEQDASSRWVMFHDPAGNLLELVQFGDAQPV